MNEQIARNVGPAGIDIAYERLGPTDAPPLLMIMGGGAQMIGWPEGFCAALVAQGLQPIRFDNRDAGHSTHVASAYRLEDMAADAIGLLDALGIARAHVLGMSLGGQIAQIMACDFPTRLRSLISMSAWTGSRAVGQPSPEAAEIFKLPPPVSRGQAMDNAVVVDHAIGSPGFPFDDAATRASAAAHYDRDHDAEAAMRQARAATASGDRTARLPLITAPTLVIHGTADRMVDPSGGRATAAAIPGARLEMIEGMGHSIPRELWPRLATLIATHVRASENTA